jgi:hypothetical protein
MRGVQPPAILGLPPSAGAGCQAGCSSRGNKAGYLYVKVVAVVRGFFDLTVGAKYIIYNELCNPRLLAS